MALYYDEFFTGLMKEKKKEKRDLALELYLPQWTNYCSVCTVYKHPLFISLPQNTLVMCCATQN